MKWEEFRQRFSNYLMNPHDFRPRFIEVENIEDLSQVKKLRPAGCRVLDAADFCHNKYGLNVQELEQELTHSTGVVLVTGITTMLKFQGKEALETFLRNMAEKSFFNAKVVILCYQCVDFLQFHDLRAKTLIMMIDGKQDHCGLTVVRIPRKFSIPSLSEKICTDVSDLAKQIENSDANRIYYVAKEKNEKYRPVQYTLQDYSSVFDVLCVLYPDVKGVLQSSYGTEEQWSFLLEFLQNSEVDSWQEYVANHYPRAENVIQAWHSLVDESGDNSRWIAFLALKSNASSTSNWCLSQIAKKTETVDSLLQTAYMTILDLNPESNDYWKKYNDRKMVLASLRPKGGEPLEAGRFVNIAKEKGKAALYFMSDKTRIERETIFHLLDKYGQSFSFSQLDELLSHIYPALHTYLTPYHFSWDFLNSYFQKYKYSKLINHIDENLCHMMEEQAVNRDYYSQLPTRTEKTELVSMDHAELWFMDAMGGEYLGYILAKCQEMHMHAKVTVCHCELPSTTYFNTEFLKVFEENNISCHNIKDLDEIKHHGKHDYDYQKVKVPIHLSEELDIISSALRRIYNRLSSNEIKTGIMISDHGATRLAIINQANVEPIDLGSKGQHNGRVCPYEKEMEVPEFVTISDTNPRYCCLANYDRFKGGRPAEVETHGGATLEEVVVPIIEFTIDHIDYSGIRLVSEIIHFRKFRRNAKISIISPVNLSNCRVYWNGKFYKASEEEGNHFTFALPDLQKAGKYTVDLYADDNLVMRGLTFTAESEGMTVNKDFL